MRDWDLEFQAGEYWELAPIAAKCEIGKIDPASEKLSQKAVNHLTSDFQDNGLQPTGRPQASC